ncbi:MAG: CRISPR-associated endonuclease Cas2 [Proteobacteria bacterium]|nr:CRISPR-associated endonuclease Cas2 [Pseudomonadota bacterium]
MLSGYRLMWMLVMFDLPVIEKEERKEATQFRASLLDWGFEMCQYSVYARFCTSQAQMDTLLKQVERALPAGGNVNVLFFTDKQYERIISFRGRQQDPAKKAPDQYSLF